MKVQLTDLQNHYNKKIKTGAINVSRSIVDFLTSLGVMGVLFNIKSNSGKRIPQSSSKDSKKETLKKQTRFRY